MKSWWKAWLASHGPGTNNAIPPTMSTPKYARGRHFSGRRFACRFAACVVTSNPEILRRVHDSKHACAVPLWGTSIPLMSENAAGRQEPQELRRNNVSDGISGRHPVCTQQTPTGHNIDSSDERDTKDDLFPPADRRRNP